MNPVWMNETKEVHQICFQQTLAIRASPITPDRTPISILIGSTAAGIRYPADCSMQVHPGRHRAVSKTSLGHLSSHKLGVFVPKPNS